MEETHMNESLATLTLTVSPGNSGREDLVISIPLPTGVTVDSCSPQTEETQSSLRESSKPSLLSGTFRTKRLTIEQLLRNTATSYLLEKAAVVMDEPGWRDGYAEAIVHVVRNEAIAIVMQELATEDEDEQE
jgi:hypothetical protein